MPLPSHIETKIRSIAKRKNLSEVEIIYVMEIVAILARVRAENKRKHKFKMAA